MRRFVSAATAGAMMLGTVMAGATGASAAPVAAAPYGKAMPAAADTAMVQQVGHRHHNRHGRHRGRDAAIALGAAGLFLGLTSLAARPRYGDPYYYDGGYYNGGYYNGSYYNGGPAYGRSYYGPSTYAAAPWSPAWYDYCADRYRSFDPRTGYFKGYDGEYHFCR